jgi:hypothetical protein
MKSRAMLQPTHGDDGVTRVVLPGAVVPVRLLTTDFPIIGESKHPFRVNKKGKVVRSVYESWQQSKKEFLHSVVMGARAKQKVEAIDGDFTNCVRSNLRFVGTNEHAEIDAQLLAWWEEAMPGLEVICKKIIGRPRVIEDVLSDLHLETLVHLTRMAQGKVKDTFGNDEYREQRFFKWIRNGCRVKARIRRHQLGDVEAEGDWTENEHLNMDWIAEGKLLHGKKGTFVWAGVKLPAKGTRPTGAEPDGMEDHGTASVSVVASQGAATWLNTQLVKAERQEEEPDAVALYPSSSLVQPSLEAGLEPEDDDMQDDEPDEPEDDTQDDPDE